MSRHEIAGTYRDHAGYSNHRLFKEARAQARSTRTKGQFFARATAGLPYPAEVMGNDIAR